MLKSINSEILNRAVALSFYTVFGIFKPLDNQNAIQIIQVFNVLHFCVHGVHSCHSHGLSLENFLQPFSTLKGGF